MWKTIGAHLVCEEEDVFCVRLVGVFGLEDARELYARSSAFAARHGYSLMLTDLTRSTGITPQARRFVTDQLRGEERSTMRDLTANANFGASLPVRAVTTLYYSAMRLVNKTELPMIIVKTEVEARAWLEKQRASIRQKMAVTTARFPAEGSVPQAGMAAKDSAPHPVGRNGGRPNS